MLIYSPARRARAFVAALLALFVFLFAASDAFARPRFGGGFRGGGGFRSSSGGGFRGFGGFRSGGSIGTSRPKVSRPSTASPVISNAASASATNRAGGFRSGAAIGANTPPAIPGRPYSGGAAGPGFNANPNLGRSAPVFRNYRPAYGGNYYVYDHRPWYTPMFLYHPPIYTPHGMIVRHGGFNWAGFLLTLLIIGLIIWAIAAFVSASRKQTVTTTRY